MNSNINNKNQGYARFANYQSPIRPNNQNIYKNLNISNLQKQTVEQEPSQQQDTNEWNEYFTYVGNIQPSKMRPNELNALIDGCLNKLYQKQKYQIEINSVSTYSDAIYVSFKCESDAIEAANYFHGMTLRSGQEPLESYYFDRCLSLNFRKNDDKSNSENNNKSSFDEGYENESARMRFKAVKTECELLISNRQLKKYADSVNEKLNKELFGISTCVKYINKTTDDVDEIVNTDLIKDALDRNLLYLIYINQANEQFNSINLIVVNKWRFVYRQFSANGRKINHSIKENKNMPLNRAIDFLKSDYHDYIGYLKEMESTRRVNKKRKQSGQEDDENEEREAEKEDEDGYSYLPPTKKSLLDQVLTRFVECRQVGVNDLDFLLTYLGREKRELIDETFNYGVDNSYQPQQTQNTSIPPLIQSTALAPPPPPPPPQQPPPPLPQGHLQQAPPLMSLMNSSGASQTPSLMSLNMASSGLNYSNNNNNFNHNNKFNSSNNMMYTNKKF